MHVQFSVLWPTGPHAAFSNPDAGNTVAIRNKLRGSAVPMGGAVVEGASNH